MVKRTQLNINIDENLLRELKKLSIDEGLKFADFIRNTLENKVNSQKKEYSFSSNISIRSLNNMSSFTKDLFKLKYHKFRYKNEEKALEDFVSYLDKYPRWNKTFTQSLEESLLSDKTPIFSIEDLNFLTKNGASQCPLYLGLKEWIGCNEFPSQDLILDLGSSLIPLIENKF